MCMSYVCLMYSDGYTINSVKVIRKVSKDLFADRNWFGKIVSSLIMVLFLPGIVLGAILQLIFTTLVFIWKLGKKER